MRHSSVLPIWIFFADHPSGSLLPQRPSKLRSSARIDLPKSDAACCNVKAGRAVSSSALTPVASMISSDDPFVLASREPLLVKLLNGKSASEIGISPLMAMCVIKFSDEFSEDMISFLSWATVRWYGRYHSLMVWQVSQDDGMTVIAIQILTDRPNLTSLALFSAKRIQRFLMRQLERWSVAWSVAE